MYDKFIDYYLDEESSKEDSDVIILTNSDKFILLKQKQIGEELFQIYGIESWFVQAFQICVKLYSLDELKIHPLILKINELIMYPNFDQRFRSFLNRTSTITSLTREKYDLVSNNHGIIINDYKIIETQQLEMPQNTIINYFGIIKNFFLINLDTFLTIAILFILIMIYFKNY